MKFFKPYAITLSESIQKIFFSFVLQLLEYLTKFWVKIGTNRKRNLLIKSYGSKNYQTVSLTLSCINYLKTKKHINKLVFLIFVNFCCSGIIKKLKSKTNRSSNLLSVDYWQNLMQKMSISCNLKFQTIQICIKKLWIQAKLSLITVKWSYAGGIICLFTKNWTGYN